MERRIPGQLVAQPAILIQASLSAATNFESESWKIIWKHTGRPTLHGTSVDDGLRYRT